MDFLSDLKGIVSAELAALGYPTSVSDDVDAVLLKYLNLVHRMPPAIKWQIEESREIMGAALSAEIRNGYEKFKTSARAGADLKPYLSTRISDPEYADLMFYDWNILHFHLGTAMDGRGFISRTNELLFAITAPNSATMYLIDIHPHQGAFSNQDFLRILESNWPEVIERYALKGVLGLSHNATNDEIHILRKAGINVMIQTPAGRVLAPMGGGITTAGTGTRNRIEADRARRVVQDYQNRIMSSKAQIEEYFGSKHGKSWDELVIRLVAFGQSIRIDETETGEVILQENPQW